MDTKSKAFLCATLLLSTGCSYDAGIPYLVAHWSKPPNLEICDMLDPVLVEDQFVWWQYEISRQYKYKYDDVLVRECSKDIKANFIRVNYAFDEDDWSGQTDWKFFNGQMISAEIFLTEWSNEWTLRHEIGHAYGWGHWPQGSDHLMAQYRTGNETYGLEDYSGE